MYGLGFRASPLASKHSGSLDLSRLSRGWWVAENRGFRIEAIGFGIWGMDRCQPAMLLIEFQRRNRNKT